MIGADWPFPDWLPRAVSAIYHDDQKHFEKNELKFNMKKKKKRLTARATR